MAQEVRLIISNWLNIKYIINLIIITHQLHINFHLLEYKTILNINYRSLKQEISLSNFPFVHSDPVRFHHNLRGCISFGSVLRTRQQHL